MIKRQKELLSYLDELSELLSSSEIKSNPDLPGQIKNAELLVPFIGAFSAGKSSLLNSLMGREVLPVGLAPETELATELRYSPESYLLAVHSDGREERLPIEALSSINERSQSLSHLQLYIDSPALKELAPLVLVDMPGYGSSIENHNKAINFYLPRGVVFVVVTSVEDGNLTASMMRNLSEVQDYGGDFIFVLSKCNLRSTEKVKDVQGYIEDQLASCVEGCSKVLLAEKDNATAINQALKAIDVNILFDRIFLETIKVQSHDLVRQFNMAIRSIGKEDSESKNEIESLERVISDLKNQHEDAQDSIRYRYSSRLLDRCIQSVDYALSDSMQELVDKAMRGNRRGIDSTITDIIRGSLVNTLRREVDGISTSMIEDVAELISSSGASIEGISLGEGWAADMTQRVQDSLKFTGERISQWSETMSDNLKRAEEGAEKVGRGYKALTVTLAVTTSVVVPLIELAIIFLPEILKWISQNNARDRISEMFQSDVFPGIKAELRNALPPILEDQMRNLLESINRNFEEQIAKQKDIVSSYRKKSDEVLSDVNARKAQVEAILIEVKSLASRYLYA